MLPYSPEYVFTATRSFALNGREYVAGEVIDKTGISRSRLQQLYTLRRIAPVAPAVLVETPAPGVTEPKRGEPMGGFMEPEPGEVTTPLAFESVSLPVRRRARSM
jgi:hypothetical protein